MMFERFTGSARHVVVQAQAQARRLGYGYIGCEHLLMAVASTEEPAGAVLRDHAVTPERIEAEILRAIGTGPSLDPLTGLDRDALASIGIDLDVVRARIEARFGPDALARALPACRRSWRPAWGMGPVAELMRRRRARRGAAMSAGPAGRRPASGPPPRGHLPFTPRAKKSLELSLREAKASHDNYLGVQHLALALLAMDDGMVPVILSALGASAASLRAAIRTRYRKAS
jgi:hypothetical protein